jgi:hypothetical protein
MKKGRGRERRAARNATQRSQREVYREARIPHSQQNAASKNTSNPKSPKAHHKSVPQPPKPSPPLNPKPSYPLRHSHWSPTHPHGSEADMTTPDSGATSPFPILSRAIDPAPCTLSPKHPKDTIPRWTSAMQHHNMQGYYSNRKRDLSDERARTKPSCGTGSGRTEA